MHTSPPKQFSECAVRFLIRPGFSIGHVSVPLRNERVYEVINNDYFSKVFKVSLMGSGMMTPDSCCLIMKIKRTMLKIAVIEN